MFLEIDHIALTSTNNDVIQLEKLGYKKKFYENNVVNSKIKKNLLNKFFKTHNITLFKKDNSFGRYRFPA